MLSTAPMISVAPALCFNCGSIKTGGQTVCHRCKAEPTGDDLLDLGFSAEMMPITMVRRFGAVVRAIAARTNDKELRHLSFLEYVTVNHPEILSVDLTDEQKAQVEPILTDLEVPHDRKRRVVILLLTVGTLTAGAVWLFIMLRRYLF